MRTINAVDEYLNLYACEFIQLMSNVKKILISLPSRVNIPHFCHNSLNIIFDLRCQTFPNNMYPTVWNRNRKKRFNKLTTSTLDFGSRFKISQTFKNVCTCSSRFNKFRDINN